LAQYRAPASGVNSGGTLAPVLRLSVDPFNRRISMTDRKHLDERSKRSIPLNVETVFVEGARKQKRFNPDDENEALKKDGSDVDTIRGDLEVAEPVPQKKRK
jgi:hypothetical protein